ncbi:MAG: sodium:proton antiporter [Bacteroidales bacterium]|nr:sodium:proton antiporter [Bacteroidales bacterium]
MKKALISLIPVVVLIAMLAFNVSILGSDSIQGASQVALLIATGIAVWLSMWLFKVRWSAFEEGIKSNIGNVTSAIVILLLIGAISGTWTMSGIVPTMICYGVKVLSPSFFLPAACIICAAVSLMLGSSWTTIATVGVALLGIGKAEGFSDGLIAGAIISGAYFGDKISPLSDTTVLASSIVNTPLFTHIRYMLITTVPSFVIALIAFTVIGLSGTPDTPADMSAFTDVLSSKFHISPYLLLVPLFTGVLIARKTPALIVLALSIVAASVAAIIFQPEIIRGIGRGAALAHGVEGPLSDWKIMLAGTVESIYNTVSLDTGNAQVNELVMSRGMTGMLNTVYLIICAMCFGACMRAGGMIDALMKAMRKFTGNRTGLVASTVGTGATLNTFVCDQYLAIMLTANIFKDIYEDSGYENRLLSRSVEDSATVTSVLVPWNTCGMTQATILSTPTLVYLPYCFFNLLSPLMSILIAAVGYKILRTSNKA